jgi:2-dehydro-3-deoxyphosphogluconate aldolase / (4S)-4-hydroxy-2-oxoglutarate aldolase
MNMKLEEQLYQFGVIPVVTIENADDAHKVADALSDGGLPLIEVTLRSDAALKAIERIATKCPNVLLGAGTVNSVEDAQAAHLAGATFLVAPGFNPRVAEYCLKQQIPFYPGVITPGEIEQARSMGFVTLKLFPMEAAGGLPLLKAVCAPHPAIRFIPTGGINPTNMLQYLKHPAVLACGGSWLADKQSIADKKFDAIREKAQQAVSSMLGFTLHHTGIHFSDFKDASEAAQRFTTLINGNISSAGTSAMVKGLVEFMSGNPYAEKGHIALGTNSIPRALRYFSDQQIYMIKNSEIVNDKNEIIAVYLDYKVGEFAVHLVQN